jgi:hypothetical protein
VYDLRMFKFLRESYMNGRALPQSARRRHRFGEASNLALRAALCGIRPVTISRLKCVDSVESEDQPGAPRNLPYIAAKGNWVCSSPRMPPKAAHTVERIRQRIESFRWGANGSAAGARGHPQPGSVYRQTRRVCRQPAGSGGLEPVRSQREGQNWVFSWGASADVRKFAFTRPFLIRRRDRQKVDRQNQDVLRKFRW